MSFLFPALLLEGAPSPGAPHARPLFVGHLEDLARQGFEPNRFLEEPASRARDFAVHDGLVGGSGHLQDLRRALQGRQGDRRLPILAQGGSLPGSAPS